MAAAWQKTPNAVAEEQGACRARPGTPRNACFLTLPRREAGSCSPTQLEVKAGHGPRASLCLDGLALGPSFTAIYSNNHSWWVKGVGQHEPHQPHCDGQTGPWSAYAEWHPSTAQGQSIRGGVEKPGYAHPAGGCMAGTSWCAPGSASLSSIAEGSHLTLGLFFTGSQPGSPSSDGALATALWMEPAAVRASGGSCQSTWPQPLWNGSITTPPSPLRHPPAGVPQHTKPW